MLMLAVTFPFAAHFIESALNTRAKEAGISLAVGPRCVAEASLFPLVAGCAGYLE